MFCLLPVPFKPISKSRSLLPCRSRWACKTRLGKLRPCLVCIPDAVPEPSEKDVVWTHLGLLKASASPKRKNRQSSALTMSPCVCPRDIPKQQYIPLLSLLSEILMSSLWERSRERAWCLVKERSWLIMYTDTSLLGGMLSLRLTK